MSLVITIFVWLAAPLIWFITQSPLVSPWKILLVWIPAVWLIIGHLFTEDSSFSWSPRAKLIDWLIFCLFLIAATGWFSSPFFFSIYLLIIAITFVLSPIAGLGLIASLAFLYIVPFGQVKEVGDLLQIVSLVAAFPLALYLRKSYLKLSESQNRILVLDSEKSEKGTVGSVLSNKVTNFAAQLRQPLVDIKNYTHHISNHDLDKQKIWEYLNRIYDSSTIALRELNRFEEDVTGHKMSTSGDKNHK
jgi:hypothetical protein